MSRGEPILLGRLIDKQTGWLTDRETDKFDFILIDRQTNEQMSSEKNKLTDLSGQIQKKDTDKKNWLGSNSRITDIYTYIDRFEFVMDKPTQTYLFC